MAAGGSWVLLLGRAGDDHVVLERVWRCSGGVKKGLSYERKCEGDQAGGLRR